MRARACLVACLLAGCGGGALVYPDAGFRPDVGADRRDARDAPADSPRPDASFEAGPDAVEELRPDADDASDGQGDAPAERFFLCPRPGDDAGAGVADAGAPVVDGEACPSLALNDPELDTLGWTANGSSTVFACGAAQFDGTALCALGGISQALLSSPPGCARPLVLTVDTQSDSVGVPPPDIPPFGLRLGGGWNLFGLAGRAGDVKRLCLGANTFVGDTEIFIGPARPPATCPPSADEGRGFVAVRRVSLEEDVAGECPAIGSVANGDFEAGERGWTPRMVGVVGGAATAGVDDGAGKGGSRGAIVKVKSPCDAAMFTGALSIPTAAALPNAALRLWSNGTAGAAASVFLGGDQIEAETRIVGTGAGVETSICLPRWAMATVQTVKLGFPSLGGLCADDITRQFAFDALAIASDPACPAGANLFDPGFEQIATPATTAPSWLRTKDVTLADDAAFAHSGRVAAKLSTKTCVQDFLSAVVTLPGSATDAGPALKFWYKTPVPSEGELSVRLAGRSATLPPSVDWRQMTACVDPRTSGRPAFLQFESTGGGIGCVVRPLEFALAIDDVELTTDATCPAP